MCLDRPAPSLWSGISLSLLSFLPTSRSFVSDLVAVVYRDTWFMGVMR